MSSSSDIEKLFDHFGGDANAYQEIGRENEARSARTRWPLLVTLDLTQPVIPAIGLHRQPRTQPPVSAAPSAGELQDTTPKDVAAVTRAKAPLFTRSHRRDVPPVVVAAAQPAAPSGASRFGTLEAEDEGAAQRASAGAGAVAQAAQPAPVAAAVPLAAVAAAVQAASATAPVSPLATPTRLAPAASVPPAMLVAGAPSAFQFRSPAVQTIPTAAPSRAPASATAPAAPAQSTEPASILGKLFAAQPQPAPPQAATPANESPPLQSLFDRLRSAPAPTSATPASAARAAAPGISNSWLVNGPRRS